MHIVRAIMVAIGVFGVVMTMILINGLVAGSWADVAGEMVVVSVMIAFLGFLVAALVGKD